MIAFSKLKSFITTKFLVVLTYFEGRAINNAWNSAFEQAMSQFTEKNEVDLAKVMLTSEMNYLRICNFGQRETRDSLKNSLMLFNIAVEVCKQLQVLSNIVGIQPMTGPVSLAYRLGFKVDKNQDLNFGSGRRLSLNMIKSTVEAQTRRLQARWSVEATQTLKNQHGLDLETEITKVVGMEIASEIINEVLNNLLSLASHTDTFSMMPDFGEFMNDKLETLPVKINALCNTIASSTRRGPGNFIVVSPMVVSILQSASKSIYVPRSESSTKAEGNLHIGLQHVGILNSTIHVYCSLMIGDNILIGYKGATATDSGYAYCPYIPVMSTGVVMDSVTFEPTVNLMTRYGTSTFDVDDDNLVGSSAYYAKLTMSPFGATSTLDTPVD